MQFRLIPDRSRLWAEARSSLHPILVETAGLTGTIEADLEEEQITLAAPIRVEIAAERLRSGNGLLDAELQRRLETRKFPTVIGAVAATEPGGPGRWRLRGDLTLHGVTRATDADVTARRLDDKTIEVQGEKVIDMRDYGLTPPKLLFLKVHPDVVVRAVLVAEKA